MKLWNNTVAFFKYWWNQYFGDSKSKASLPKKLEKPSIYTQTSDDPWVTSWHDYDRTKYNRYLKNWEPDKKSDLKGWKRVDWQPGEYARVPISTRKLTETQARAKDISNEEFRAMFKRGADKITTWRANGHKRTK